MIDLEEKIRALRAHAASARAIGSHHEADAFERAAAKLAASSARAAPPSPGNGAQAEEFGLDTESIFTTRLPDTAWFFSLAKAVADACDVEACVRIDGGEKRGFFFGEPADRARARALFQELYETVRGLIAERQRSMRSFFGFTVPIALTSDDEKRLRIYAHGLVAGIRESLRGEVVGPRRSKRNRVRKAVLGVAGPPRQRSIRGDRDEFLRGVRVAKRQRS